MHARALVTGSSYRLTGVENDVRTMQSLLDERGFHVRTCSGAAATRSGILDEWERLVRETTGPGPVVIYFAGHGGRFRNPSYKSLRRRETPRDHYYQFIVPCDMDSSRAGDFRGIMTFELYEFLARLAEKTDNIVLIHDCCHAPRVVRSGGPRRAVARSLPETWTREIEDRWPLAGDWPEASSVSTRQVVVLSACAPEQFAYEYTDESGERRGAFTSCFARALRESGDQACSYEDLMTRVRFLVARLFRDQRPDAEGPARRILFTEREASLQGRFQYYSYAGRPALRGGQIHGIREEDVYRLIIPNPSEECRVVVTEVRGTHALVRFETEHEPASIPDETPAVLYRLSHARRYPVRLVGSAREIRPFRTLIDQSPRLKRARKNAAAGARAVLRIERGRGLIEWPGGEAVFNPVEPVGPAGETIRNRLENMGLCHEFRQLSSGTPDFARAVSVEGGRVIDSRAVFADFAAFPARDRPYLLIRNGESELRFVVVFFLGIDFSIRMLTAYESAGVRLEPGDELILGLQGRRFTGIRLDWPECVPTDAPRRASFVVIICNQRVDRFRGLETDREPRRNLAREPGVDFKFAVRHVDLWVLPPDREE